jgi:hypothetical protein
MKLTRLDAAPQLNHDVLHSTDRESSVPDASSSESGIRPAMRVPDVTVVFRGMLPMERLVELIRRRAGEKAPALPLRVEVEQLSDLQGWRVRLHTAYGEVAASESGPFLAVSRAFSLLQ